MNRITKSSKCIFAVSRHSDINMSNKKTNNSNFVITPIPFNPICDNDIEELITQTLEYKNSHFR